jgi:hypothetical protein
VADLYVQFSDCGQHIRKWSMEPFEGGVAYLDRDATANRFVNAGKRVTAHTAPEARTAGLIFDIFAEAVRDLDAWLIEAPRT